MPRPAIPVDRLERGFLDLVQLLRREESGAGKERLLLVIEHLRQELPGRNTLGAVRAQDTAPINRPEPVQPLVRQDGDDNIARGVAHARRVPRQDVAGDRNPALPGPAGIRLRRRRTFFDRAGEPEPAHEPPHVGEHQVGQDRQAVRLRPPLLRHHLSPHHLVPALLEGQPFDQIFRVALHLTPVDGIHPEEIRDLDRRDGSGHGRAGARDAPDLRALRLDRPLGFRIAEDALSTRQVILAPDPLEQICLAVGVVGQRHHRTPVGLLPLANLSLKDLGQPALLVSGERGGSGGHAL